MPHGDAVSGNGIWKVGTLNSAAMDIIGQLRPNTAVIFVRIDLATALQTRHDRLAVIHRIQELLA